MALGHRLSRIDKQAGNAISLALQHWENPSVRGKKLGERLKHLLNLRETSLFLEATNCDNLLEWLVALKITRQATECGWHLCKTCEKPPRSKYGDILLKKGDFYFRVAKGKPLDGNGMSITNTGDIALKIAQRHGLGASGFEPDIVLSFFHKHNPKRVITFLADAKNNEAGDGNGYMRTSIKAATSYVHAFQDILVSTPKCTLFFVKINVNSDISINNLSHDFASDGDARNDVLCLNAYNFHTANNQPDIPASMSWFELIQCKAIKHFQSTV